MRTLKKDTEFPKLTGEQIIQKKLNEMNILLKNTDLTKLPKRQN